MDTTQQQIVNLCAVIGDKEFAIRQIKGEISKLFEQIDDLRKQLPKEEPTSGSEEPKQS